MASSAKMPRKRQESCLERKSSALRKGSGAENMCCKENRVVCSVSKPIKWAAMNDYDGKRVAIIDKIILCSER